MSIDRRSFIASILAASVIVRESPHISASDPPWIMLAGQDSGPAGRWGHVLVFDSWNTRLLVFGGRDERGAKSDTLWSFDLASAIWTNLSLDGPAPRWGSAAASALDGSGFFLFGGASGDQTYDDLWWFDFATTTWQIIESDKPAPSARAGSKGVADSLGRFVISHGQNDTQLFDDTWAFDPTDRRWTDITPVTGDRPMARFDHEMLSLPDAGLLLLTDGCSGDIGPCPQGDLWAYDTYANSWLDITPAFGPSPRRGTTMAQLAGTILLVGGMTDIGPESDVWRGFFDGATIEWNELTYVNHGPMGIYRRWHHAMTSAGNEFYVFGGNGVEGALGDLWAFSLDRFTESDHSIEPSSDIDEQIEWDDSGTYEEYE